MRARDKASDKAGVPRTTAGRRRPAPDVRAVPGGPLPVQDMLELQRTAGNAAVSRFLTGRRHSGGDGYRAGDGPGGQRSAVSDVLRSPGTPLDAGLRREMEARLGADFSDVRLHTDAVAQRSAADLGARAYTSGRHIVAGTGGLDKHTLAHELTHVLQQRSGPVAGTDAGDGLSVSDPADRFERAAEANATAAMAAPAPVPPRVERGTRPAGPVPAAPAPGKGDEVSVQCAVFNDYHLQRPVTTHRELRRLLLRLELRMLRYNSVIHRHDRAVQQGDYEKGHRPDLVLEDSWRVLDVIRDIHQLGTRNETVGRWCDANSRWLGNVTDVVKEEIRINADDWQNYGYFLMKHFGEIWNRRDMLAQSNSDVLVDFEDMSQNTMASLRDDRAVARARRRAMASAPHATPWTTRMQRQIEAGLRRCVLRHYSPADKVRDIMRASGSAGSGGTLKSNAVLENEGIRVNHNTGEFDFVDLANHGFVFFYIEPADAGFRASRFGGDDPARITLPISMLERENGWVMVNDFLDREFPTLRADRNGELLSYTRGIDKELHKKLRKSGQRDKYPSVPEKSPEGKLKKAVYESKELYSATEPRVQQVAQLARSVRRLAESRTDPGRRRHRELVTMIGLMRQLNRAEVELQAQVRKIDPRKRAELRRERRKALADSKRYSRRVRIYRDRQADTGVMHYHGSGIRTRHLEPLAENVLVGGHAIPGLAQRCVVEVARMERLRPDVARRLKNMSADELIKVLLKDFIRPQAMLQKQVPFRRRNVEFKGP